MDDADRQRVSAIAHATSPVWGPLFGAMVDELVARVAGVGVAHESRVLDLGCGPAELLRRIVERTGASGIGLDSSPFAIAEARARLARSSVADRIELRLEDVRQLPRRAEHDLVLCVGPGWDTGGWRHLTEWAAGHVAPAGHLLLADGAWRRAPTNTELAALGMEMAAYPPSESVEKIVADAGVEVLWSQRVTADDWVAYGTRYRGAMLGFLASSPHDPIAPAVRARLDGGWAMYELLHSILDFVLVLGRRTADPGSG